MLLHGDRLERADQGSMVVEGPQSGTGGEEEEKEGPRQLEPVNGNGQMVMESTTVKKLVADPEARVSLETLWRRLPVVQGQIEVGEAGG